MNDKIIIIGAGIGKEAIVAALGSIDATVIIVDDAKVMEQVEPVITSHIELKNFRLEELPTPLIREDRDVIPGKYKKKHQKR